MTNFQRVGAISNAHVGRELEGIAAAIFAARAIVVQPRFKVSVGVAHIKRMHEFDLGSHDPAVLVECKAHTWTEGDKVPSAKMINWAEAMYYFSLAPAYRRIFFVQRSIRHSTGESLVGYFLRTKAHLVPVGVEIWEYDFKSGLIVEWSTPQSNGH